MMPPPLPGKLATPLPAKLFPPPLMIVAGTAREREQHGTVPVRPLPLLHVAAVVIAKEDVAGAAEGDDVQRPMKAGSELAVQWG